MKIFKTIIALLIAAYVGSYLYFSLKGRYQPIGITLEGKTVRAWAPQGFMENFQYTEVLPRLYLPLLVIDRKYWHTAEAASGAGVP